MICPNCNSGNVELCYLCNDCAHEIDVEVKTNADRIRSMSDEELALWVISIRSKPICHQCENRSELSGTTCYRNGEEWCKYGIMAWLKQEVE